VVVDGQHVEGEASDRSGRLGTDLRAVADPGAGPPDHDVAVSQHLLLEQPAAGRGDRVGAGPGAGVHLTEHVFAPEHGRVGDPLRLEHAARAPGLVVMGRDQAVDRGSVVEERSRDQGLVRALHPHEVGIAHRLKSLLPDRSAWPMLMKKQFRSRSAKWASCSKNSSRRERLGGRGRAAAELSFVSDRLLRLRESLDNPYTGHVQ
jgi:hypothetical protein